MGYFSGHYKALGLIPSTEKKKICLKIMKITRKACFQLNFLSYIVLLHVYFLKL